MFEDYAGNIGVSPDKKKKKRDNNTKVAVKASIHEKITRQLFKKQ